MTDEANIAPAAPSAAVIDAPSPNTPELGTQTPMAEKPAAPDPKADKPDAKAEVSKSAGDAVRRANEALKAKAEAETKPVEKKVEPKEPESRTRSEDGKFASKESPAEKPSDGTVQAKTEGNQTSEGRKPHHEPPARFQDIAKKDWDGVPDTVKEDVHRVISENEKGIQKYKENADRWEGVREWDEIARKNGRAEGLKDTMRTLVDIENAFERNPIEGLKKVTDHFGLNLQAVAAHIMGQNPNQQVADAHARIKELEGEIQQMKQAAEAPKIVQEFFAAHEDAESYAEDIAFVLKTGIVGNLEDALEYVKRFKPASNAGSTGQPLIPANSATAQTQAPAELPLNPAGQKSVSGAPTGGFNPAAKRPVPKSNREALERAAARVTS
ncbi:hypothetical protein [Ensifer sp. SL37]|uniref:hypothetical protein n=1 Tax=Ensifer sp. SL37 TaxID=2995137 RepID=UPI002275CF54|nr:hypothetical protein [Ensifer sp. SL37]MCY1741162.1 hypothetical protein [Ensifer sp. SL37]